MMYLQYIILEQAVNVKLYTMTLIPDGTKDLEKYPFPQKK